MTEVHIRFPIGTDAFGDVFCIGLPAHESVSYEHYVEHVLPNAGDCCAGLVTRMCLHCMNAAASLKLLRETYRP